LGSLDDIDGSKVLRRVMGRFSERGQELGDNQLGDIVLVEPQDNRHFSGSQTGWKAATIKEQGLFIKGNRFLGIEHRRAFYPLFCLPVLPLGSNFSLK
jgi:hypothetical protein